MHELAGLTALIIEPHAGMRASIHNMLSQGGITRIEHAGTAGTAIRPIKSKAFDLVVCEYDLGEGQDGQQLLEDLRHNKLIPTSTVFIMVTAERNHEKVLSAAELALNDYVLKPFTAERLIERIIKAIDKRNVMVPIYLLVEQGKLNEAIEACLICETAHTRYAPDFMRLRAELHTMLGELAEAEAIYTDLYTKRSIAWARLGLATTLFAQDRFEEAGAMLTELIVEKQEFLEAYDWLAKTQEATGQIKEAQATLESAVARSPHALQRLRRLGKLALETGDTETAHRVFQTVVSKARYSEFREPEDHVSLVEACIASGEGKQVSTIIRDLAKSFSGIGKFPACRALASALMHKHNGDDQLATAELAAAVTACKEQVSMSNDIRITLAKNCLDSGMDNDAVDVMTSVLANTASVTHVKAMRLFKSTGREDLAQRATRDSKSQIIDLVSAGAEKARLGDFQGAVGLMSEAADKFPENPQVVFNAAVAVLKCLDKLGWDDQLGERARHYIANARRIDARNPRLSLLSSMYRDLLKKYAIGGASGPLLHAEPARQVEKQ